MYFKIYDKVVLSEGAAEYLIRYKSIRNKYFFCLAYLLCSVVQICRTDRGLYSIHRVFLQQGKGREKIKQNKVIYEPKPRKLGQVKTVGLFCTYSYNITLLKKPRPRLIKKMHILV